MGTEAFLRDTIQAFATLLRHTLPGYLSWATDLARRVLEYVFGPILDHGGRFPWWGLAFALAIAAGVFWLDRSRADGGFLRYCFPREIWRGKSTWVDLKIGFFNYVLFGGGALNLTWRFSSALFATWVTVLLTATFGANEHHATWGPVSIGLFVLAFSVASDFGYFLFHWTAHVFPPLWAIHKVHHSAEVMTPLTAARVHALEHPILEVFRTITIGTLVGPLLYLYGGEPGFPTILGLDVAAVAFFALGHVLHHSHVWVYYGPIIGRIIVSPAQHQIHHSCLPRHLDKNFAEHWAIWDTIFGTLYLPQGRETLKLGLAGYQTQPHPGVVLAFFRPIYESAAAAAALAGRGMASLRRWRRPDEVPGSALTIEHLPDPS